MATYEITSPDGQRFEITAPDNATQEQVLAYAQANFAQSQQDRQRRIEAQIAADRELYSPVKGMSGLDRFLAGAGRSFVETGEGLGQIFGVGPTEQEVSERRRLDEPLMATTGGQIGSITGTVAQSLALPGGQFVSGARLLPALAAGAVQGGLLSGIQAVGEGESRLKNTTTGAAFGAAGTGVTRGLGRVFDPLGVRNAAALERELIEQTPAVPMAARSVGPEDIIAATPLNRTAPRREAAADLLQRYGIEPTLAQRTGARPLQTLESVLADMPATSAQISAKRAAQQSQFNRQIANFMGEQGDEITEDTIDSVLKRYDDLSNSIGKSTKVAIDDDALNGVEQIWQEAALSLGTEQKALFQQAIDRLIGASVKGGMPGDEFVKIRSQLTKASTAPDAPFAGAMRGLRDVLDDALEKSAGQKTAEALKKARQQARLAITLRDYGAVGEGSASIRKTANAIERANRKGKMPKEVKEFTRAAKEILPDYVPNSMTAERSAIRAALTGQQAPLALGAGAGLLTGDPVTGLAAAGAMYGGPRAVMGLMNTRAGGRYLAGEALPNLPPWLSESVQRSLGMLPLAADMSQ